MFTDQIVAIVAKSDNPNYPSLVPYRPDQAYPELKGRIPIAKGPNVIYDLFRKLAQELGMDIQHYSGPDWNPFGDVIKPGQKVLIKPNLVRHKHNRGGAFNSVVTHASLIRCVLDYVALALKGQGHITLGDAPLQGSDFSQLLKKTGLQEICNDVQSVWKLPVSIVDFRLRSVTLDESRRMISDHTLQGDIDGYCSCDLADRSMLTPLNQYSSLFRVTNYDVAEMQKHHNSTTHEYLLPRSVLDADVVLNIPKLKTHRKVGLTAALKNLVGINGHKDWLPHHRCGSPLEGGDEYLSPSFLKRCLTHQIEQMDKTPYSILNYLRRLSTRILSRLIKAFDYNAVLEGDWYGNDTLWRTVLDLNRLLIYADSRGNITKSPQRFCMTIVDAIVAGEGEGPLEPDARPCGILVGGINPVAVDTVLATMVGFDYTKIPLIERAYDIKDCPLINFTPEQIQVLTKVPEWHPLKIGEPFAGLRFNAPSGWLGKIESNIRDH
ncbi:MAG: DUF362 domain-containing protein [Thermodesulfobacteriota bacterium]|nr:DUF362 domain-containing protein [Thermodesulfobacteriota bacterium]